jgi:iron only hydrogenase large subunit-like protein
MACVGGCIGGSGNLVRYEYSPEEMTDHIEGAHTTEMIPNMKKHINRY